MTDPNRPATPEQATPVPNANPQVTPQMGGYGMPMPGYPGYPPQMGQGAYPPSMGVPPQFMGQPSAPYPPVSNAGNTFETTGLPDGEESISSVARRRVYILLCVMIAIAVALIAWEIFDLVHSFLA